MIEIDTSKLDEEPGPRLPLLWVDRMQLTLRGDLPVATLQFYSVFPDKLSECSRIQTSVEHLQRMVKVICDSIGYYPGKPDS